MEDKSEGCGRAARYGKKTQPDGDLVVFPPWCGKGMCFPEWHTVLRSQLGIFYKVSLPRGPLGGVRKPTEKICGVDCCKPRGWGADRGSCKQPAGADRGEALPTPSEQWPEVLRGTIPQTPTQLPSEEKKF